LKSLLRPRFGKACTNAQKGLSFVAGDKTCNPYRLSAPFLLHVKGYCQAF
jgi:hypothetical protein